MKIYMAVTADKFELPVAVCDTPAEIARHYRMTMENMGSYISRGTIRKKEGVKFIKVEVS